jgi:hypothetical protein
MDAKAAKAEVRRSLDSHEKDPDTGPLESSNPGVLGSVNHERGTMNERTIAGGANG